MMNALVYYKATKEMKIVNIPMLKATPEHVIVKMAASNLLPVDAMVKYGAEVPMAYKSFPDFDCLGFEGSGIVEEIGEGVPPEIKGKKVAFSRMNIGNDFFGSFSQYSRVNYKHLMILEDYMNLEECSGLFINPLTALDLIDQAKQLGAKAAIATAGASSLAKILGKVGPKLGLEIISIVRKKEDVLNLNKIGIKHALNSSDPSFDADLKKIVGELKATVAFDAVCGDIKSKLADALLPGSTIIVYGALGGDITKLNPVNLIFKGINLKGSALGTKPLCFDEKIYAEYIKIILEDMKSTKNFKTEVVTRFTLDKFNEAYDFFPKVASIGKVILTPNYKPE